jgi:glycine cleavage system H lipoate-binding protein
MNELEVMCLDCEEQWDPIYEVPHCICDDPADDAWMLYIKDRNGSWVRVTLEAIDARHFKNGDI